VLVRGVDERLKEIVDEVADELQCEVLEREVMPDQVDMLCEVDPQFGIDRLVKRVKARRSRWLRQEFDGLTSAVGRQSIAGLFVVHRPTAYRIALERRKPTTNFCCAIRAACRHAGQTRILWRR
jgi:hypothetical protein